MRIIQGLRSWALLGAIVCLLMFTGCAREAGNNVANPGSDASTAAPREGGAIAASSVSPSPLSPITTAVESEQRQTKQPDARNTDNRTAGSVPSPQIGTGGSDFFLFTQARVALGADSQLQAANVILDIKAGVVTLSGTVATAAQKSRAEQLIRAVGGVKEVRNRLRISS